MSIVPGYVREIVELRAETERLRRENIALKNAMFSIIEIAADDVRSRALAILAAIGEPASTEPE